MPAPTLTSIPELPSFPSGPGRPDQPAAFFPKAFAVLTALQKWPDELAAFAAYLETLSGGGGGGSGNWGDITGTLTDQTDLTAYIAAQVAALADSAPGALDTLNELAAALGDDANFASTVTTALAGKQPLHATLTALAGLSLAQGDILYRDASGLQPLAAGSSGQFLKTFGPEANPAWATVQGSTWTTIASGTFAGNVTVTDLDIYNEIFILLRAVTASASGIRIVQVSTDNGSNYFSSSGNYVNIDAAGVENNRSNAELHTTGTTAARSAHCHIVNTDGAVKAMHTQVLPHYFVGDASNRINAIRLASTAGSPNGGTYRILGR